MALCKVQLNFFVTLTESDEMWMCGNVFEAECPTSMCQRDNVFVAQKKSERDGICGSIANRGRIVQVEK